MSPQFVDVDDDGRLDLVAATYDGSPKWARGTAQGFEQPVHVLDRDGARIVMNQFWNFDTERWDTTERCDPAGVQPGHLTSAWACDWDRDGDLDLLLGDHDAGQVMWRRNDGTSAAPRFATRNEPVRANGAPLVVPGTVTTLLVRDVTGDGREDLVVGSMGDTRDPGASGGGVQVFPDVGDGKARVLGAPVVWVPRSEKGATTPTRPDAGLYMDVVDHDGDGDLDLVVGGYSCWEAAPRVLTAAEQARVPELQAEIGRLTERLLEENAAITSAIEALDEDERARRRAALLAERGAMLADLAARRRALQDELDPLTPGQKRRSFVWLYENVTPR